jgi:hypothetical protein
MRRKIEGCRSGYPQAGARARASACRSNLGYVISRRPHSLVAWGEGIVTMSSGSRSMTKCGTAQSDFRRTALDRVLRRHLILYTLYKCFQPPCSTAANSNRVLLIPNCGDVESSPIRPSRLTFVVSPIPPRTARSGRTCSVFFCERH